jgi:hypothetical protein
LRFRALKSYSAPLQQRLDSPARRT